MLRITITITLEPDVEALLEKAMRERGQSLTEAANSALRTALGGSGGRPDFTLPTFDMGSASVDLVHAPRLSADRRIWRTRRSCAGRASAGEDRPVEASG